MTKAPVSNKSSIELERPQTECGNTRRGLTIQFDLDEWRAAMNGTRTPTDRFNSKVDRSAGPDACWPFTATVSDNGYGQFWDGKRLVKAHRFAFAQANGSEATGDVDHICHNGTGCPGGRGCQHRACCNPAHLEDVTHAENVRRGQAGKQSPPWKTVCIHGHEYTPENQYIDKTGHQVCRACAHARYLKRKAIS